MKKFVSPFSWLLLSLSPLATAGVVMDLVTTSPSGQETERSQVFAQSGKLRMEHLEGGKSIASMIFLGDKFLYVDHREKSYIVMDEAALEQVSAKVNEAMAQMEAELAKLPPEQRAMVEQMMKGQMPGMGAEPAEPPPAPSVKAMGGGEWGSYDCQQYAVFESGEKTQEICAAGLDDVDGADDLIESFRNMSAYMTKMSESLPMRSSETSDPGALMELIDGFPVHTIDFANGVVVSETSLESVVEKKIDEGTFGPPENYRRQDPFGQP